MTKAQNLLADTVVYKNYAKYKPESFRRETFNEVVTRSKEFFQGRFPKLDTEIDEAFAFVYKREVMPSMRMMQFAGKPIDMIPNRTFNCSSMLMDDYHVFSELMFLLLGGSGVGFSVMQEHVNDLPPVVRPAKPKRYMVGDSIVGWSDAVKVLMEAFFFGKYMPRFDFSDIRSKGMPLKTTGGKAPGPAPLEKALKAIEIILRQAEGRQLKPIEVFDISCFIADAVMAGGIRRSATICFFDYEDMEMRNCKTGDWMSNNIQRCRANISVALLKEDPDLETKVHNIMESCRKGGYAEPGIRLTNDFSYIGNPCLIGSTQMKVREGLKSIQEIAESNGEADFYNVNGDIVSGKAWITGIKPTYIVKAGDRKNPYSLQATADHRVMTVGGNEVKMKDLQVFGDRLQLFVPEHRIENDLFTKYGFLHGDGSYRADQTKHKKVIVDFSSKDQDVVDLFGRDNSGTTEITYKELESLGINTTKKTFERNFPVLETLDQLQSFLKGMYTANGCVIKNHRVAYKTASPEVRDGLQIALTRLGISSTVTVNKPKVISWENGDYISKESYDINIVGIQRLIRFYEMIGFVQQYKMDALQELLLVKMPKVFSIKKAERLPVYDFTLYDDTHWGVANGIITHNCMEIEIPDCGLCNLTEVKAEGEFEEVLPRVSAASFIATLQASFTDFWYLRRKWQRNAESNPLIGVSLTGIAGANLSESQLSILRTTVEKKNVHTANLIDINPATRITCVKPAGSTSLVMGTSAGIHAYYAPYYYRTVQVEKASALGQHFMKELPDALYEDCVYDVNSVVVKFPIKSPDDAVTVASETLEESLDRILLYNKYWIGPDLENPDRRNNVSCTVYADGEEEWDKIEGFIIENAEHIGGLSVFPKDNGSYTQPVFAEIDDLEYHALTALWNQADIDFELIPEADDNTDLQGAVACAGGACEII